MKKLMMALAGAAALLGASAGSATVGYEFGDAPTSQDTSLSLGFLFSVSGSVRVTALGYYDQDGDGLTFDHNVGIFDTQGNLLLSTLVPSGTGGTLNGHFRYVSVTPFTLSAGSYVAAATTGNHDDAWAYGALDGPSYGFATDPAITIGADAARYLYQSDDVLRLPTEHYRDYRIYAGPNFQLLSSSNDAVGAVPEPASWALMIAGFGLVGAASRRSRRRSVAA